MDRGWEVSAEESAILVKRGIALIPQDDDGDDDEEDDKKKQEFYAGGEKRSATSRQSLSRS